MRIEPKKNNEDYFAPKLWLREGALCCSGLCLPVNGDVCPGHG